MGGRVTSENQRWADEYDALVELCLESNDDQPGFDRWSAIAAVDSMLDEASGSLSAVRAMLMGEEW